MRKKAVATEEGCRERCSYRPWEKQRFLLTLLVFRVCDPSLMNGKAELFLSQSSVSLSCAVRKTVFLSIGGEL